MRRIVLIVPGLLGNPEDESPLRQNLPSFRTLSEVGSVFKVAAPPRIETPEALYLGMRPNEAQMRQGPLTVAALGADPPERSTHFHLSLMSFEDGVVRRSAYLPTLEELDKLMEQAERLNTPKLTQVRGEGVDHALVWEARGDLGTTSAADADGKPLKAVFPEGDGEKLLRRLIDDSVNLLSDMELNQRRVDEGLGPINLLWPWGHGERRPVPNLLLRRGEQAVVESNSLRLAGLTRLSGYRHEDRRLVGEGVKTRLGPLAARALSRTLSIVVIDAFAELRSQGKEEEIHWLARELDRELLKPWIEAAVKDPTRLTLLAPSVEGGVGLGLVATPQSPGSNVYPFDERSLDERLVPTRDLWQEVESGVTL
jgi:hypothetical protein